MRPIHWLAIFLGVAGCGHQEKDSHTEVFKTPQQAVTERQARMLQSHKELAISVLRFARPDIEAKVADGSTVTLAADGVTRAVDLASIEPEMVRRPNEERAILRRYLEGQMRPFDAERVKAMGFDNVKSMAAFELMDRRRLEDLQALTGEAQIRSMPVLTNLNRVTVIRRTNPAVVV